MRIAPKKIMCAVDFSEHTGQVLTTGSGLAKEFGSQLIVCHVLSNVVLVSSAGQAYIVARRIEEEQRQEVETRMENLKELLDIPFQPLVLSGHPATVLTQTALEEKVDLVIAATHGRAGINRFLVGSVTDRLVKTLACPLMVLPPGGPSDQDVRRLQINRILVGCDFSRDSALAFNYGLSLAQEFQADLFLAHVIRFPDRLEFISAGNDGQAMPGYDRPVTGTLARIEQKLFEMVPEDCRNWCTPITAVLEGEPWSELIRFSKQENVDLIVLGIHGRSLLEQFLVGSTTDRVIGRGKCPVLAVRQEA